MSANLREQWPKLVMIAKMKRQQSRKDLCEYFASDTNFLRAIREIMKNVVQSKIPLSRSEIRKLFPLKRSLLYLTKKTLHTPEYRKRFKQVGGAIALPILLPRIAHVLGLLYKTIA